MSRQKTERLLSLVVCLLSARRYLTAGQIRDAVPGYPETFDAFKRMFERDKDELRELGIPLETGTNPGTDEEVGYRISRQAYELPEIRLEPDEAAVLGLAARVWRQGELAGAAAGGLLKLRAAGIDAEETTQPGIEPRLQTGGPAFGPLWQAVKDRRPVTFGYHTPGRATPQRRNLEPWGVVNRHGRWYVAGFDRRPGVRTGVPAKPDRRPGQLHRTAGVGRGPARHRRAQPGPGHRWCPAVDPDRRAQDPAWYRLRAAPEGELGPAREGRLGPG